MLDAQARGVCDRVLTLTGCSEPANGLGLLLAVQRVEVRSERYRSLGTMARVSPDASRLNRT
jgi:hypothetical protein